jgi:hypothetical protein
MHNQRCMAKNYSRVQVCWFTKPHGSTYPKGRVAHWQVIASTIVAIFVLYQSVTRRAKCVEDRLLKQNKERNAIGQASNPAIVCPLKQQLPMCPLQSTSVDVPTIPQFMRNENTQKLIKDSRQELLKFRDDLALYIARHQNMVIKMPTSDGCSPRIIAYVCRNGFLCGGLGDRIRGHVIGLFQALLTDSIFVREVTKPTPLDFYFQNLVTSKKVTDQLHACRRNLKAVVWKSMDANNHVLFDYATAWKQARHIEVTTNASPYQNIWKNAFLYSQLKKQGLQNLTYAVAASAVLKLYHGAPTAALKQAEYSLLESTLVPDAAFRIGMHIRTGQNPSFHDPPRHSLGICAKFAEKALELCLGSDKHCAIFIASDHPEATSIIRNLFTNIFGAPLENLESKNSQIARFWRGGKRIALVHLKGSALHLDKMTSTPDPTMVQRTYLEWHILAYHTDFILASSSGFSVAAIHANLAPHLMFVGKGFVSPENCSAHHCRQIWGDF